MSFFSLKKEVVQKSSDIPPEFFSAVVTMSDDLGSNSGQSASANPISPSPLLPNQRTAPFLAEVESTPIESHQPSAPAPSEGLKGTNPFLPETPSHPGAQSIENAQISFKNEISFEPVAKRTTRLFLFVGGGILLAIFIAVGAWYYVKNVLNSPPKEVFQDAASMDQTNVAHENTTESLPFALDKPNYISINTETATPGDVKKLFDQSAARMITAHMTAPVEFLVTDQNNNPIAFSRFAYIEKFEIDTGLLALVEESFSCFVYNDAGQPRIGLGLTFKNPTLAAQIISKKETVLPYAFRTLLYDGGASVSRTAIFRSGMYNTQAVRYVNVDSARNFSFDYVLQGKRFLVGASKDTLRAMIDQSKPR